MRLEWNAAPASDPLPSAALGHGPWVDTGAPLPGSGSYVDLEALVSGCTPGTPYHWRLRIASDQPRFNHSPWFTLPGSVPSEVQLRTAPDATDSVGGDPSGQAGRGRDLSGPNPFRPGMEISYALRRAGPVRLTIHDLSGRLVATLIQGWMGPGTYQARWDGRGRSGEPASSGIYFTRCTSGGRTATWRFTLLSGRE